MPQQQHAHTGVPQLFKTWHDKEVAVPKQLYEKLEFLKIISAIFLSTSLVATVEYVDVSTFWKLILLWGVGVGFGLIYVSLVHIASSKVKEAFQQDPTSFWRQRKKQQKLKQILNASVSLQNIPQDEDDEQVALFSTTYSFEDISSPEQSLNKVSDK